MWSRFCRSNQMATPSASVQKRCQVSSHPGQLCKLIVVLVAGCCQLCGKAGASHPVESLGRLEHSWISQRPGLGIVGFGLVLLLPHPQALSRSILAGKLRSRN